MKGLVLEVREETVILMSPQGRYIERPIPHRKIRVGQTIQVDDEVRPAPLLWKKALAFASVLIACLIGAAGYGYTQPFGVVNLDINPSFQMTYNAFERILTVQGLNDDAELVLQGQSDLRHMAVPDAVQMLIAVAQDKGFIGKGQQNVMYCAVSDRYWAAREERLLAELWDQAPDPGMKVIRVLLKGSPELYRRVIENGESPIPELMSIIRSSGDRNVLFNSDIPIQDIRKPLEPENKPIPETGLPLPLIPSPEEEKPAVSEPDQSESLRKDQEIPKNGPVSNPVPTKAEGLTEQPMEPATDPEQGRLDDSVDPGTAASPTQGEQQGNPVPSDGTAPDEGGSSPAEPQGPGEDTAEGSGSDSGDGGDGSDSPSKGGS